MSVKRLLKILTVCVIVCCMGIVSYARENAALLQAYAWEQSMDIFVMGEMKSDHISCKISNQTAEIVGSGLLADREVTVRTTILVDISTSMPSEVRDNVKSYLKTSIQNLKTNEQYRIITFCEEMNVLQDFTADRYDLAAAVDKIEFNGQWSKIYDALYNTIPEIQPLDGSPCYYRTIIITDGIDDTVSGITKEELYLKLQADTYPIDIVAVSKAGQTDPDKELAALMRMGGGEYVNLHPDSDIAGLCEETAVKDIFWIQVTVPEALLDGVTRQVNVTDGESSLQFDVKIPVFDIPEVETPAPTEAATTKQPVVTESPIQDEIPVSVRQDTEVAGAGETLSGDYLLIGMIGIGAVCLVIVFLVIVFFRRRTKGKRGSDSRDERLQDDDDHTVFVSEDIQTGDFAVKLYNMNSPGQNWDISFSTAITIGRDKKSQICLSDKSVSHCQCRIFGVNGALMIENKSQTNITRINSVALDYPQQLKKGDKIRCGRVLIIVEEIHCSDSNSGNKLSMESKFINV